MSRLSTDDLIHGSRRLVFRALETVVVRVKRELTRAMSQESRHFMEFGATKQPRCRCRVAQVVKLNSQQFRTLQQGFELTTDIEPVERATRRGCEHKICGLLIQGRVPIFTDTEAIFILLRPLSRNPNAPSDSGTPVVSVSGMLT